MDLQSFIEKRPYLYHLTSAENAKSILEERKIYSTNRLIDLSGDPKYAPLKRTRRSQHEIIYIDGRTFHIRDQQPISELALGKCLTHNWEVADFLEHLNDRVFMWPTVDRLEKHFARYKEEQPIILRFITNDIIAKNPHVKFCRLNSGATRPNTHLGGIAPARGPETFLPAEEFEYPVGKVAEVTFKSECNCDCVIYTGTKPDGNFTPAK